MSRLSNHDHRSGVWERRTSDTIIHPPSDWRWRGVYQSCIALSTDTHHINILTSIAASVGYRQSRFLGAREQDDTMVRASPGDAAARRDEARHGKGRNGTWRRRLKRVKRRRWWSC